MAQLVGNCPAKQKVTSWIPGQGTCLGCGFVSRPQSGCGQHVWERQPIDISLPSFSLPSPLSKNKQIKSKEGRKEARKEGRKELCSEAGDHETLISQPAEWPRRIRRPWRAWSSIYPKGCTNTAVCHVWQKGREALMSTMRGNTLLSTEFGIWC